MADTGAFVITITVDGMEYPLDIGDLTGREYGVLREVAHIEGLSDIGVGIDKRNMEVVIALAGVAMQRAGIKVDFDRLLDMKIGDIKLDIPDVDPTPEADKPPESVTPGGSGTLPSPTTSVSSPETCATSDPPRSPSSKTQ